MGPAQGSLSITASQSGPGRGRVPARPGGAGQLEVTFESSSRSGDSESDSFRLAAAAAVETVTVNAAGAAVVVTRRRGSFSGAARASNLTQWLDVTSRRDRRGDTDLVVRPQLTLKTWLVCGPTSRTLSVFLQ